MNGEDLFFWKQNFSILLRWKDGLVVNLSAQSENWAESDELENKWASSRVPRGLQRVRLLALSPVVTPTWKHFTEASKNITGDGEERHSDPNSPFFIDIGRIQSIRLQEYSRCYGGGSRPRGPALALKRGTTEQEPAPPWGTKRIITHWLVIKTPQKATKRASLASGFILHVDVCWRAVPEERRGLTSAKSGLETRRILLRAFWQAQEFNFFPVYGSGFRDEIQEMPPRAGWSCFTAQGLSAFPPHHAGAQLPAAGLGFHSGGPSLWKLLKRFWSFLALTALQPKIQGDNRWTNCSLQ